MDPLRLALSHETGMWFGVLLSRQNRLVASAFSEEEHDLKNHLFEHSRRVSGMNPEVKSSHLVHELANLFNGRKSRGRLDFEIAQLSPFQQRVHRILMGIPTGRVTTYGRIADILGSGPRAVGNAVGGNPWPLFVPCHRVIPASGLVGQYSMIGVPSNTSSIVKQGILEREGVPFVDSRVPSSTIWRP